MPVYKKKIYRKKRRNFRKNRKSLVPLIKRVMNKQSEHKYFDTSDSDTSLINTDDTALIGVVDFSIPQGDTQSSRQGNSIFAKGFMLRYNLSVATLAHSVRMLLIRVDRYDSNIATSISGTDFDNSAVGLIGNYPRDIENYKYKVLWDSTFNLDPNFKNQIVGKKYFNLKGKKMTWADASTSTFHTNKLLLLTYTDNTLVNDVSLSMTGRLLYRDA